MPERNQEWPYLWRTAAILAVFLALQPVEAAGSKREWKDAWSQGPFQLGTLLSQFRSLRDPENKAASPVCSDRLSLNETDFVEAHLSDAQLVKAGVVKCVFFIRSSFKIPIAIGLDLGGHAATTEFYFINPEKPIEKYLFLIYTKGRTRNFVALLPDLEKVYGQPRLSTESWRNKTGVKRNNEVATWENAVSRIELKQLGLSADFFSLRSTLTPLMAIFNGRLPQPDENGK